MPTTTSYSLGYKFSRDYVADGWYNTINNGELTSEQESALVDALIDAEVDAFEALLPESHYWLIDTSELQYPVGDAAVLGDLDALLKQAVETVMNRLPEIEARVLAGLA
ncbi:hypothetical protein [Streptosporangium amethystogenes]|uniref:hypothetical protein n=1 Tax=Streptosporangium amethystogenes TaxID=2002 RepID=UPI0004BD0E13|nr:hypothetical protein [Streptosporangium amethystogenes]KUJ65433.1 hypothetical protein ACZ90_48045 [Streptomyces albus subsp. albus]